MVVRVALRVQTLHCQLLSVVLAAMVVLAARHQMVVSAVSVAQQRQRREETELRPLVVLVEQADWLAHQAPVVLAALADRHRQRVRLRRSPRAAVAAVVVQETVRGPRAVAVAPVVLHW